VAKRKLHDWLTSYLKYTENSEAPTSYHAWVGISCIAATLQRHVYMVRGHSKIYPNQYIVLVGPSGEARKGEAISIGRSVVEAIGIPIVGEDNSQEAIIRDMRNSIVTFTDKSTGKIKTQCAVSCFAEELAVFTGYQNSTLLAYMTNWYDSRDLWTRRTKHQGVDEIRGMCFNLIGGTAPDWIPHIFTRENIGGGLTSRIMFVVEEERGKIVEDPNEFPPDKQLQDDLTYDLENIHMITGAYKFTDDALDFYKSVYRDQEEEKRAGRPAVPGTQFGGYMARRAVHLIKTAMALSAAVGDDMFVKKETVERALCLILDAEKHMSKVFRGIGKARYSEEAEAVLDFVRRHKVVKRSDLLRYFERQLDMTSLEAVERVLEGMKLVEIKVDRDAGERIYRYIGD